MANFIFQNINEKDIDKIIQELDPKFSSGKDGISIFLFISIKSIVIKPLAIIINQLLSTGIFPDRLKVAKVVPLFKKGDKSLFSNYRPISLLPSISKIFEKVIFYQLYAYLEDHKLLYTSQYGFRKKHSTELAALELIDKVTFLMQEGKTPVGIFLNMSKAFDTLNHDILLDKLAFYGISGVNKDLFKCYLSNRKQYVQFNGEDSHMLNIRTGVLQGSILGPLLFLIYINDFVNSSKLFHFMIFADDTTVISKTDVVNDKIINQELGKLLLWLQLNKLSLNISKSKCIFFHQPQKKCTKPAIKIDGNTIDSVDSFNFLGLIINNNLKWDHHINNIAAKISRSMSILTRLRHSLPFDVILCCTIPSYYRI